MSHISNFQNQVWLRFSLSNMRENSKWLLKTFHSAILKVVLNSKEHLRAHPCIQTTHQQYLEGRSKNVSEFWGIITWGLMASLPRVFSSSEENLTFKDRISRTIHRYPPLAFLCTELNLKSKACNKSGELYLHLNFRIKEKVF